MKNNQQPLLNPRFRKNVAAVILEGNNCILLAKRKRARDHWQFPQGGVDFGESFSQALFRELKEELGTGQFEILKKSNQVFRYQWRKNLIDKRGHVGQEQTYFLLRFLGQKKDIKPDKREFETVEWLSYEEVLQRCARIRKPLYTRVLKEFESIIKAKKCPPPAKTIKKPEKMVYSNESIKSLAKFLEAKS